MNRGAEAEIIDVFAEKHGIGQSVAEAFVKHFADLISEGLKKDKMVKVKGLGTFKVIEVKGRESVNVNNGERILIEGREKISFTPDAVMKDLVNKPFSQFDTVVLNDGVVFSDLKETTDYANDGGENLLAEPLEEAEEAPFPGDWDDDEPVPASEEPKTEGEGMPVDTAEEPETSGEGEAEPPEEEMPTSEEEVLTPVPETITPLMDDTPDNGMEPTTEDSVPENNNDEETQSEETDDEEINNEDTEMKGKKNIWGSVLTSIFVAAFAFALGCFVGSKFAPKQHLASEPVAMADSIPEKEGVDSARIKDSLRLAEIAAIKVKADSVTKRNEQIADSLKKLQEQRKQEEANRKQQEELQVKKDKQAEKANETKPAPQPKTSGNQVLDRARLIMTHGAYRIVGTDQTITVRKGQTMQSIARTYLGSEMACYIQCHNNVAEVQEGMKLKIPKLELKKKKK